jgi:hypothetical protein
MYAEFTVLDALPDNQRVGLFAQPRTYPAFIRFANASSATDREKDVRGMSIKLRDVRGPNLTADETAQDFILNSHPVMLAAGTREFLELLKAVERGGLTRIPTSSRIRRPRASPGGPPEPDQPPRHPLLEHDAVSVRRRPRRQVRGASAIDRLARAAAAAHRHLPARRARGSARAFPRPLRLHGSQANGRTMPIEDESVEWKEQDSPYHPVARIRIPRQRIDAAERATACEQVAFNPWHCLAEHRPLGNFNRARRDIYHAMAQFRGDRIKVSSGTR